MYIKGRYRDYKFNEEGVLEQYGGQGIEGGEVYYKVSRCYEEQGSVRNTKKRYRTLKEAFKSAYRKLMQGDGMPREYVIEVEAPQHTLGSVVMYLYTNGKTKLEIRDVKDPKYLGEGCRVFCYDEVEGVIRWGDGYVERNKKAVYVKDWIPTPKKEDVGAKIRGVKKVEFRVEGWGRMSKLIMVKELDMCMARIQSIIGLEAIPPIEKLTIGTYKTRTRGGVSIKTGGKYQATNRRIVLDGKSRDIRKNLYHEYGHHIYSIKKEAGADKGIREVVGKLRKGETLQKLREANYSNKAVRGEMVKYRTYLMEETEIFARVFSSMMLYIEQCEGESRGELMDFTAEEVRQVYPLIKRIKL